MSRADFLAAAVAALALSSAACEPDLGAPISVIGGPRILAVRGTPAEAKEGAQVTYDLLAVDVNGTIAAPAATWTVCTAPRPPSENSAVATACFGLADTAGPSPTFQAPVTAADPNDPMTIGACSIFGPLRPPLDPNARPRDPDITGGFYEPVRATLLSPNGGAPLLGFDLERIQCRLANAPSDVANQFNNPYDPVMNPNGYTPNGNPSLAQLTWSVGGAAASVLSPIAAGMPAPAAPAIAPGQHVSLEASWSTESVETFSVYSVQTGSLSPQREAMRVSWFATAGELEHDVSGRAADDAALTADNDWVAPATAGPVRLWLVLRDTRGGVDFAEYELDVSN
jgi:hypothetical protein